jgi:hypothetical protein
LVAWNMFIHFLFFHILGRIIPTDHIFQRGRYTTNQKIKHGIICYLRSGMRIYNRL